MNSSKFYLVLGSFCTIALISRLIPHPPNFTALGALLLICAGLFKKPLLTLFLGIGVYFVSDLILNNLIYSQFYSGNTLVSSFFIYIVIAFSIIVGLAALLLKNLNWKSYLITAVLSSLIFFLVSNYGVWSIGGLYPMTNEGLIACYTAAIPYLAYDIAGTLVFGSVMYAVYSYIIESRLKFIPA